MITLITNKKRPRVMRVIGKVRITNKGFTMAFKKANTKAKTNAVPNELTCT